MAFFHHDPRAILGSTANGTLKLTADEVRVKAEITLPDTTTANDVAELVQDGYVGGMSFSMLFDDVLTTTQKTEDGRTVLEVSAFTSDEVTVTATPAFTGTSIGIKEDESAGAIQPAAQGMSKRGQPAPERVAQSLRLEQLRLGMVSL